MLHTCIDQANLNMTGLNPVWGYTIFQTLQVNTVIYFIFKSGMAKVWGFSIAYGEIYLTTKVSDL